VEGDRAGIVDAGSRNGTFLHGARRTWAARLEDGDEISPGVVRISCRFFGANLSAATKSDL
jgi:pSer/pThr/pTyr-binding forkhead associated (FHA) protein